LNTLRNKRVLMNSMDAVRWMLFPTMASVIWYTASTILGKSFLGVEPFYPGMLVSIGYLSWHKIRSNHGG
jgi:hypothetical protein